MRRASRSKGAVRPAEEPMSVLLLGLWELATAMERQPPDQAVTPHVMALVQECESLLNEIAHPSPGR